MTADNVGDLELQWGLPEQRLRPVAVNAAGGRRRHVRDPARPTTWWRSTRATGPRVLGLRATTPSPDHAALLRPRTTGGVGILGDTAVHGDDRCPRSSRIDAVTGSPSSGRRQVLGEPSHLAYAMTVAPLVIDDKVDRGRRRAGSTASAATSRRYDAEPRATRCGASTPFRAPGEPGNDTWEPCPPDS